MPLPNGSVFYEFLPEDQVGGDRPQDKLLQMHQLKVCVGGGGGPGRRGQAQVCGSVS